MYSSRTSWFRTQTLKAFDEFGSGTLTNLLTDKCGTRWSFQSVCGYESNGGRWVGFGYARPDFCRVTLIARTLDSVGKLAFCWTVQYLMGIL